MIGKQKLLAVILLAALMSTLPLVYAQSLQKPTVTVPSGWNLKDETAYPDAAAEHDPAGAGMLQYINPENGDEVKIFYEKAQSSYNSPELKDEAETLFERDLSEDGWTIDESGTKPNVAGVSAGFAKGYDAEIDAYVEDLVFVKGNYYFNVLTLYDATSASETAAYSLINSISAGSSPFEGTTLLIIVGVVVAIIVVVVVVVFVARRKKKSPLQQTPQMTPGSYPPPPPPPPV